MGVLNFTSNPVSTPYFKHIDIRHLLSDSG